MPVHLVDFERRHLAATLQWMNDPALMRLLGRGRPFSYHEHQRWFEELASRSDCRFFAVEDPATGKHLGNAWLWDIDPRHHRAEVRIVIGSPADTSKGLGSEAIRLISTFAFETLDLNRVYAYILAFNERGKRAFEKAGFTAEGLLRSDRWSGDGFVDVHVMGRLRTDAA
jgi:RimJ/RimL family protein N-acetyltransferase